MRELDPLLHSQLRLAVVSLLLSVEEADFSYLKDKTQATSGNLSVQIDKLSEAGYIEVRKEIIGKKPRTSCRLTDKGRDALNEYVSTLKEYLGGMLDK
ncbi:transcriptional regulator [Bacteroides gallinaceum]|uniref:Transcriptional regulator n=1 Tax=Candidatus Phocaeicola excrementipullorum TaxID=2838731 RepID=A0A948TLU4_9BACT|nr:MULTISPECIES: transcriptional regulator [Bacteroides]MBU3855667.1 transcriptional regulator [Candidatus Phocaeicola excrementipullorum]MBW9198944.1 transcriptional regulator [Bacteroidales bacterium SW299]MCR8916680.1 transcriptional regulator [Bacteroides sp. ET225]MDM8207402.1 transcriptional regulator [Bacteroides gallinaceum]